MDVGGCLLLFALAMLALGCLLAHREDCAKGRYPGTIRGPRQEEAENRADNHPW